ncbi:MAG: trigger factor [Thermodesulfovibrionales bacterium]|jgi:trigger factor
MLKVVEDISATKKRLKFEISADAMEKEILGSLEKVRKTATLPGFRPGRAPMTLIEKKYGKKVEGEVLDRMIPQVYADALKAADITPVTDPVLEQAIDFKRHEPFAMTLTVEILPKIEDLAYENIVIKDIPLSVDDADVTSVLKRMQEEKATYDPSEGPVGIDDLLSFDYSTPDGDISVKDQIYKVGGSLFPKEFSEQLTGMKKNDERNIEAEFPEDHVSERLAGKRLTLYVALKDIKKVNLPTLDDEFAKDMGLDNLDALKNHVREEIFKAKTNEVTKIRKAEIMRKLLDSHKFDLPESMLENEIALLVSNEVAKAGQGSDGGKDREALEQELRPHAMRHVKGALLLTAIGKKERVSVSEDEVKNAIRAMSGRFGVPPEDLIKFYVSKDGSLGGLKNSLFEEKVLDLILSKAIIEKGE